MHICEDILRSIINNTADTVFALDLEKRYLLFNDAHKTVMKARYGADITEGVPMMGYIRQQQNFGISDEVLGIVMRGETVSFEGNFDENSPFNGHTALNIIPLKKDDTAEVIGIAVFARNISKEKDLQQQNYQYTRMMEIIVSDLSHKLRKPVATILGLIQLIDSDKQVGELQQVLSYLRESTDELDNHLWQMTRLLENKAKT